MNAGKENKMSYVTDSCKNMVDVTTEDFASMMVCAVRYALGRET